MKENHPLKSDSLYELLEGDVLKGLAQLPTGSVQCVVTSPPYWALRDYGAEGQLGHERTPTEYIARLVAVFREVRRVLKDDGVVWLNLGDTYATRIKGGAGAGSGWAADPEAYKYKAQVFDGLRVDPEVPDKNLIGIPWRVAFALQADGWLLRADVIWHKPNAMPESATTRPTRAHEYLFLLAKRRGYFYNAEAIKEPARKIGTEGHLKSGNHLRHANHRGLAGRSITNGTRNARSVWTIAAKAFPGAHFATFPERLAEKCVLAGSRPGDIILDPFSGAATSGVAALRSGRRYIGLELNPDFIALSHERLEAARLFSDECPAKAGRKRTRRVIASSQDNSEAGAR